MTHDLTLEQLIEAVRNAESLDELKRLVGPSVDESEAARNRLALLDSISRSCEWDSMMPSLKAQEARERYRRVESAQAGFESMYC